MKSSGVIFDVETPSHVFPGCFYAVMGSTLGYNKFLSVWLNAFFVLGKTEKKHAHE